MWVWRPFKSWLPWHRRRVREADLERELRNHLELEAEEQQEAGMSAEEAAYAARRALGNTARIKEDVRAVWGFQWLETILQDLRYGLRQLRRNPGFTAVAILTLALGIGGTTSVFTIINRTLLHALPFPNSDRLMFIRGAAYPPTGDPLKWWSQANAFKHLAVYGSGTMALAGGGRDEQVNASIASATLFPTLGVRPRQGRDFSQEEDLVPGEGHVAIVSRRLWAKIFGSTSFEAGQTISLDGRNYAVIGVMPRGFQFPGETDVWLPRAAGFRGGQVSSSQHPFPLFPTVMIGRLRPGASPALASAQLNGLLHRLTALYTARTGTHFGERVDVHPLQDVLVHNFRPALEILFAAALLLMLIACANAANLFLARAATREKEIAVRMSLGASRARIIRLAAAESVLLALAAGAVSIVLASFVLSAVRALGPIGVPGLGQVRLDLAATTFSFSLAAAVGFILGSISGIRNATAELSPALHAGGFMSVGGLRRRVRNVLVVAQVAIALILLAAGSVMIQSFIRLTRVDPGFDPRNLVAMSIAGPPNQASNTRKQAGTKNSNAPLGNHSNSKGQPKGQTTEQQATHEQGTTTQAFRQALQSVSSTPGVVACGLVDNLPLSGEGGGYIYVDVNGKGAAGKGLYSLVYGNYFRAMGIPLLRGRGFRDSDGPGSEKVIIVSQTFARKVLHERDPVGETVRLEGESGERKIVGLVGDVRFHSLGEASQPEFYLSYGQPYRNRPTSAHATLVVRTAKGPAATIPTLRDHLRDVGQGLSVLNFRLMSDLLADATAPQEFRSLLIGSFAALGVLLAVLGVYGLVSYTTARRTHEFAIRAAFGARRRDVLLLILRQGAALALVGIIIGLLGAFWLNRVISGLLFGVSPTDPKTLAFSAALLFCSSLATCLIPARRAAKVDPMVALRYE